MLEWPGLILTQTSVQARRETQSCRGAWTSLSGHAWGGALTSSCTVACHTPSASSTLTVYNQPHHRAPPLATPTHPCVLSFPWDPFTSLDGFLSTSPTPPPLRSPWLRTVTMHMSSVSHVCSLSCSVSSAGSSSVNRASHNTVKTGGGKRYRDSTATFLKWHLSGPRNKTTGWRVRCFAVRTQTVLSPSLNPAHFSSHVRTVLPLQSVTHHLLFEDFTLSSYRQTEYSLWPRLGGRHLASQVRDLSGSNWACSKDGRMAGPHRGAMASVASH